MSVTSNNIIEIWDKKKYEDAVNIPNEDFENLAERVMGSLGNKEEGDVS
jgi:DNA-binding transcriptional regulator/RsmH inhibitor MraZ